MHSFWQFSKIIEEAPFAEKDVEHVNEFLIIANVSVQNMKLHYITN